MKLLAIALIFVSSLSYAEIVVETGTYKAVDVETGAIDSTLMVREDKTVNFKVKTPDFEMPEPGCEGTYIVNGGMLIGDMTCPLEGLEKIQVKIDVSNVTPENIRSPEGVIVDVMIDAIGTDAFKFKLTKIQ